MNIYYVAGMPYSDELYHHGVKGQKWGVRRYQNPDGTLTEAGRKRYGNDLGEYGLQKQGVIRKLATGDWALGTKRFGERRERNLENKIEKRKTKGEDTSKLERKLNTQKERNIARDKYNSKQSTGKLVAQRLLLGSWMSDSYRSARGQNVSRGEAAVGAALGVVSGIPIVSLAYDVHTTGKRVNK